MTAPVSQMPLFFPPDTKTCPSCGETKPKSEFYADRSKASGLPSPCKECDLAKSRRRYAAKITKRQRRSTYWQ